MKRLVLKISIFCVIIATIIAGLNYYRTRPNKNVRGLNEYNQWEYNMIKENPEYDDLKILIDISEKRLYLLNGSELIKKYPIASGREGHPSPIGSWKIISKNYSGSGFGSRFMGLNVPWGTYQREYGIG